MHVVLDLKTPMEMDSGIQVIDTLRFFTGDHPAAQFEQDTKQGLTSVGHVAIKKPYSVTKIMPYFMLRDP